MSENPDNYLNLSIEQIKFLDKLNYINPLNYDPEYLDIYERERNYRYLNGYDHLVDISSGRYKPKHKLGYLPTSIKATLPESNKDNIYKMNVITSFLGKFFD